MPRPPNYSLERTERDRAKAKKKAEKLAAKNEAREQNKSVVDNGSDDIPGVED